MKANLTKTLVSKLNIGILPVVDESGDLTGTASETEERCHL